MSPRRYEVLFFDFGGTLAWAEPSAAVIWSRALEEHGYRISSDEIVTKSGVRGPDFNRSDLIRAFDETETEFKRSFPAPEEEKAFFRRYDAAILRRLGLPHDEAMLDTVQRHFETIVLHAYEDVRPALTSLGEEGYRLGIISNASHDLPGRIEGLDLTRHFESITYSYAVGAEKPDPRIFRAALATMKVWPAQAVHVGDRFEADVRGASRVGMTPMLIDRKTEHPAEDFIVLRSLTEIGAHLEGRNGKGS
ncbi:MAG: HAD family hydrolase [Thermoplasmata archaeon]